MTEIADGAPRPAGAPSHVALGPTDLTGELRIGAAEDVAAGLPAVRSTVRHVVRDAGLRRGLPLLRDVNQTEGFDCPSCAWPDPAAGERSFAEFCENGAKAVADAGTKDVVTAAWLDRHPVPDLAVMRDRDLNRAGRLAQPVIRHASSDRFRAIGWDEAYALAAEQLRSLASPDEALFYTSGRASNEAAFLYQLFVRAYGTNNLPDCSNLCHESSGRALGPTIGIGKGTVLLEDFDHADVIVVIGQNPGTNHPRMLTALQGAAERGATIVSINPMREAGLTGVRNPQDLTRPGRWGRFAAGTDLASMHLPVRIGGDLALLTGVQKALLERNDRGHGGIAHGWIAENTVGAEELVDHLRAVPWEHLEQEAGIPRLRMAQLADTLAGTDRIIWCWAMGLTQHEHAVPTIQQIVNLALMRGSIGIRGGGLCPVRGHSNVQGDRTVGIWERPTEAFLDRLAEGVGFTPPREHGFDVVDGLRAMHDGRIRSLVTLGGNLLSAAPDTAFTAEAMEQLDLAVHITTKLNRSHLVAGDRTTVLLLPCLARTDRDVRGGVPQFVTCENSMGIVAPSEGRLPSVSEDLRSEPAIVAELAAATLGPTTPIDWSETVEHYDRIRDLIEASVAGFEDYNARVREPGGFALPNPPREGRFPLPDGRARFTVAAVPTSNLAPDELVLMTIRSHDQFNTTIYDHDDRYRGVHGERRVVFLSHADVAARGLATGDVVDLVSHHGGVERRAVRFQVVPYDLPRGNAAAYFPEANVLVPIDRTATDSNTPTSKHIPITLTPPTPPPS